MVGWWNSETHMKNKIKSRLSLNGGELQVGIDQSGNVCTQGDDGWKVELTAKELDRIAAVAIMTRDALALVRKAIIVSGAIEKARLAKSLPNETRNGGYPIQIINILENVDDYGGCDFASFGCQDLTLGDVLRVHASSRKARGLK
jgi:hypothetical protein